MKENNLNIPTLLNNLYTQLNTEITKRKLNNPIIIGIRTGGVWIAEEMRKRLKIDEPIGLLDISFYRDDFSQIGMNPKVKPSRLPKALAGSDIILIDDVFYTGRTIRAALNEIFDFGRPNQIILGTLIERNGRQIPLQPDCVGEKITLQPGNRIKLTGPDPLQISIKAFDTKAA
ncbi:MAG: bifunctional pyr operon transcriptional regulator/uracil phosphoribosyltransferase PyrR [Methylococcaceae bacterium]